MFTYAHVLAACLYHYISVCLHMHQMQMINLKKGIYIYIYIPPEVHTLLPLSWPPHAHLCWCHARGRAWASRLCQNGGIWCWEPKIMRDGLEGCVLNSPQQLTHVHPVGPFFFKKKTPGLTVTASNGVEKGNYQLSFRGRAARLADVWMFYHWEEEMSPL